MLTMLEYLVLLRSSSRVKEVTKHNADHFLPETQTAQTKNTNRGTKWYQPARVHQVCAACSNTREQSRGGAGHLFTFIAHSQFDLGVAIWFDDGPGHDFPVLVDGMKPNSSLLLHGFQEKDSRWQLLCHDSKCYILPRFELKTDRQHGHSDFPVFSHSVMQRL
jgi:hypothetical protein